MRDLLTKTIAGSMIAGAALLVAACGTNEEASTNNTMMGDEALMDSSTNDVTAIDAGTTGADANMGMDAGSNMSMDTNVATGTGTTTTTTNTTTGTTGTTTNGM